MFFTQVEQSDQFLMQVTVGDVVAKATEAFGVVDGERVDFGEQLASRSTIDFGAVRVVAVATDEVEALAAVLPAEVTVAFLWEDASPLGVYELGRCEAAGLDDLPDGTWLVLATKGVRFTD